MWATWTFWMERYCGYVQAGLRSKVAPWANLNNRLIHKAYIEQIDLIYDLKDPFKKRPKILARGEQIIEDCKIYIIFICSSDEIMDRPSINFMPSKKQHFCSQRPMLQNHKVFDRYHPAPGP